MTEAKPSQADEQLAARFYGAHTLDFAQLALEVAAHAARARSEGVKAGLKAAAKVAKGWNGETADGNTFFIAEAIRAIDPATCGDHRSPPISP